MTDLKIYTRAEVATVTKESNGNYILKDFELVNLIKYPKNKRNMTCL